MANLKSLNINGINIFDLIYPIGSVYISEKATDPSTLFGGKWERIKGKVIVGVDENDIDFKTVNKTGGEKSHTLTKSEMPRHYHDVVDMKSNYLASYQTNVGWGDNWFMPCDTTSKNPPTDRTYYATQYQGESQAHNNLQPYISLYMWKRIS